MQKQKICPMCKQEIGAFANLLLDRGMKSVIHGPRRLRGVAAIVGWFFLERVREGTLQCLDPKKHATPHAAPPTIPVSSSSH